VTESELLKRLQLRLSDIGRFFRNHVGLGWQGEATRIDRPGLYPVQAGDVVIRNARPLRAGLCVGSSDLVGWVPHTVTPDDVGRTVSLFATAEAKSRTGRLTPEQRNFLAAVRACGGIAIEARDVEEAVAQINQQRTGQQP
jgi:hypothetical protein